MIVEIVAAAKWVRKVRHQKPFWFPRMPLVTKTVIGTPLDSAIGSALVRLSR
jgi:hypothetical protein